MKGAPPASLASSSRDPAPIQNPTAAERTWSSRSEMTRSPESSSVSTQFCIGSSVVAVTQYRFLTTWIFDAPIERVWERLDDPGHWPDWWRGVEKTEVLSDDHWRSTWRSFLPYTLSFEFEIDRRERPYVLGGRASGELAGTGVWRLF